MKARRKIEQVATMAALLANPLRLELIERLRQGPRNVGHLVDTLGENQATVSKQLAILREAGLVTCRPEGRCREYALASGGLAGKTVDSLVALGLDAAVRAAECRARRARRLAEQVGGWR
jgi:DNA-binding transcriptional ArsR family regulator